MNDNDRRAGVQKSFSWDNFKDTRKLLIRRHTMPSVQFGNQELHTPRNLQSSGNTNIRMLSGIYSQLTEPLTNRSGFNGAADPVFLPASNKTRSYTYIQPSTSSGTPRRDRTPVSADRKKISLPHPDTICLTCSKQRTIRRSRTTGCLNLDRTQGDIHGTEDCSMESTGRPQARSEVCRQDNIMRRTDSLSRITTSRAPKTNITPPISSDPDSGNEKLETGTSGVEIDTIGSENLRAEGGQKDPDSKESELAIGPADNRETNVGNSLSTETMQKRDTKFASAGSNAAIAEKVLLWMETLPDKFSGLNPLQIIPTYEPPEREPRREEY